jgi:hypothetical protein
MSLRAHGREGDRFELLSFDGKLFVLIGERAYAPGNPMPVIVELTPSITLELKSIGSRVRDDQRYDIRARATTLPKPTRERLVAALQGG